MSEIKCSNICKTYGKKQVLDHINLTLEKGKIYGLIGRNGAGKTTLLSIITAQNPATSGTVTIDGQPVWDLLFQGAFHQSLRQRREQYESEGISEKCSLLL